jgi:hypothetical protein
LPLSHRRRGPLRNAAPAAPQPAQIDRNGVLILIRSTVLALDQANKTGNYTVLRDLGAPGFQANTAARLAEIFASQRRDNLDLSGVAVIDPQLMGSGADRSRRHDAHGRVLPLGAAAGEFRDAVLRP